MKVLAFVLYLIASGVVGYLFGSAAKLGGEEDPRA